MVTDQRKKPILDLGLPTSDLGSRTSDLGPPSPAFIPYGRQQLDEADIQSVIDVLRSDWLTCGPAVERFECALAAYCGAKHVIAVSNGTAALHVAMLAAGIKSGDRVITSPITFLASANCAEYVGATADFVDIDPRTYNLDPAALSAQWRDDVRAVVAVDFAGRPCHLPEIAAIARKHAAIVIEDAAHALGSRFMVDGQEYKVGSHPWADMTTFSFHPVKTITTGEGGAIATNDDELAQKCRLFRSHGMIKDANQFLTSDLCPLTSERGSWFYEMQQPGYNYRITDLQCALGCSQLQRLDAFIQRRQEIAQAYQTAFRNLPWITLPITPPFGQQVAWHLYVVQIAFATIGTTRTRVMQELTRQGIGTQVHYIPVHLQPYYARKYGYALGKCPMAEAYYQQCLSLPLYPAMTNADVARVITAIRALS